MIRLFDWATQRDEVEKRLFQPLMGQGWMRVYDKVAEICRDVAERGFDAVAEYTGRFDGVKFAKLDDMRVGQEEFRQARGNVGKDFIALVERVVERVEGYHRKQAETLRDWTEKFSWGYYGERVLPLKRVGVYVPGGKAPLVSSLIMGVVPARVAGVGEIVVTSPPDREGRVCQHLLATAEILGVNEFYKVGGAQAIAGLAFGVFGERVDMIAGAGNYYVTAAKKFVQGICKIDALAGPSEVLIIADSSAGVEFVAWDMLAQSEHSEDASAILIALDRGLAERVARRVEELLEECERGYIMREALEGGRSCIIFMENAEEAIKLANRIAPEHLEICTRNPDEIAERIENAGALLLGTYSGVAFGDYGAGPNHILPTGGTAKFSSPLGVWDFVKRMSLLHVERGKIKELVYDLAQLAQIEGLGAHKKSLEVRGQDGS